LYNFHKIKVFILVTLSALLLAFPVFSIAANFSEKHAFCSDEVNWYTNTNYINQKIYNKCMKNADNLIASHEKFVQEFKSDWDKRQLEFAIKWSQDAAEKKAKREEDDKRKKLMREQEIKKYDDLFDEFN